jgi:hypothetical protein
LIELGPEKAHQLVSGRLVRLSDQIAGEGHRFLGINFNRNVTDQYPGRPEEQELKGWSGRDQSGRRNNKTHPP